ncbi:MAG TPA: type I secretion C-terminal target domain-containing protein, partial [Leptolyngbyaceae cyanobacterium]
AGADKITTGGGRDLVVYTSIRDTRDTITDFSVGNDKILLAALLDDLVAGGYNGTNAIADGYVKVVSRGVNTVVQIDNDGFGTSAIACNFLTLQNIAGADASNPNNFVFN